tara:strand:+ start:1812 stop:2015 length:204 start_codon:yes stop_codon:yes gene_type:complete
MNNIDKALAYFRKHGIGSTIDDGSLYVDVHSKEESYTKSMYEVQISQSEIDYRAEMYNEEQYKENHE